MPRVPFFLVWAEVHHVLAFLMHESDEATLFDAPGPVKPLLGPVFKPFCKGIAAGIDGHFRVPAAPADLLKRYDVRMLATEKRDLMPRSAGHDWSGQHGLSTLNDFGPFDRRIVPLSAEAATDWFMRLYRDLGGFVNKRHHIDAMVLTTRKIVAAYKDGVARGVIDNVFRQPLPPGRRAMVLDDIGMGSKDVVARNAVAKIAADLRSRKFLSYLFDERPDNVGAYGNIDSAFDLSLQREIFATWEHLIREAIA